jgi:O-antigen ligase
MIAEIGRHGRMTLTWAILAVLLLLPSLLGSISSIVSTVLALFLAPLLLRREAWTTLLAQPAMLIFAGVFLVLALCFAITARDPGNILYAFDFLALLVAPALYLAATKFAVRGSLLLLCALCALGAVIAAAVAINDVALRGLPRAAGFIMGGNVLARIALVLGFVATGGLFLTRSPYRFLLYLAPLAALLVTYLTQTRGAALAVPALVLILALFLGADRQNRRQLLAIAAVAAVVLGLMIASDRFGSILRVLGEALQSGSAASDSASEQRLEMLRAALGAFQLRPWLGYGWANLSAAGAQIVDMTQFGGPTASGFQFHNDLANFSVAAGVVGVLCWLALLAAPLIGVLAGPRDAHHRVRLYCCLQLSAAYAIFGLTDLTLGYDLSTTLYAFLTALALGLGRERPAAAPPA